MQIAKWLIRHTHILSVAHGHHLLIGKILGFFVFTLEDKLAHLWQIFLCLRMTYLIWLSCPDSLFVYLYAFNGRCTKHHTSDDAVTNG